MSSHSEPTSVVLIGFMGAGKSTVARELERLGGFDLIDLDALIVEQTGRSIPEIFAVEGEERFRAYETSALRSLAGAQRQVIATGGGIIGREENWQIMRQLGSVVYLRASWTTLDRRLAGSQGRPLADAGQQRQQVEALWRRRLPLYEQADFCIDTDGLTASEVAREILHYLEEDRGKRMFERLTVGLGERSYPIWVGDRILDRLGEALHAVDFPRKIAVVTNPIVYGHYGERVLQTLADAGFAASVITVADGEEHKNLRTLEQIYDALIGGGFDRYSGLVALGGGVIGDITGFAAATFLRGVPFVQVPTTLLAQVDSSVGGKTAVNHPLGKNLIGAFYQPRHVHIDVATLATLPEREFAAGMAEVIKYGIIRDADFFAWLGANCERLQQRECAALVQAVKRSCQIKADIVELDEKESSLRAILNYGHTFGHAVETLVGYGEFRHGEAVAIGMRVAAEVSRELGYCTRAQVVSIESILRVFALPEIPPPLPLEDYLQAMGRDKKVKSGVLRFILNRGIGDCLIHEIPDPDRLFAKVLQNFSPDGQVDL